MCGERCRRCWSRTPVASLLSFVLYIITLSIYIGCTISFFEGFIHKYFDFVSLTGIIIPLYLVLLGVGVLFFIAMILSSGESCKCLCNGMCCNWTARLFQMFNILVASTLVLGFIVISGFSLLPSVLFILIVAFCKHGLAEKMNVCDILAEIGLKPKDPKLCEIGGAVVEGFCTDGSYFYGRTMTAYVMSILISLCLIYFLVCMATNYVRLKIEAQPEATNGDEANEPIEKGEAEMKALRTSDVKLVEQKPGNPFA